MAGSTVVDRSASSKRRSLAPRLDEVKDQLDAPGQGLSGGAAAAMYRCSLAVEPDVAYG